MVRRVDQFHPTLSFGDAVGNQILSVQRLLRALGYESDIYCEHLPDHFQGRARTIVDHPPEGSSERVLLAHFSLVYSKTVMDWLARVRGRKVLVYHNVTPHTYFEGIDVAQYESVRLGREQFLLGQQPHLQQKRIQSFARLVVLHQGTVQFVGIDQAHLHEDAAQISGFVLVDHKQSIPESPCGRRGRARWHG